jgi:hypothetical protein
MQKGQEQVMHYHASHRFAGRPDLKAAVLVFIGKNEYRLWKSDD